MFLSVLSALLFIFLACSLVVAFEPGRRPKGILLSLGTRFLHSRRSRPMSPFRLNHLWRRLLFWRFLFWSLFVLSHTLGLIAQFVGSLCGLASLRLANCAFGFATSRNRFLIRRHVLWELIVGLFLQELLHEIDPHRQCREIGRASGRECVG